jgi:hypothetical protein
MKTGGEGASPTNRRRLVDIFGTQMDWITRLVTRSFEAIIHALVPFSSLSHRRSFIMRVRSSYQIGGSSL